MTQNSYTFFGWFSLFLRWLVVCLPPSSISLCVCNLPIYVCWPVYFIFIHFTFRLSHQHRYDSLWAHRKSHHSPERIYVNNSNAMSYFLLSVCVVIAASEIIICAVCSTTLYSQHTKSKKKVKNSCRLTYKYIIKFGFMRYALCTYKMQADLPKNIVVMSVRV